jgi:hypothetical protein
MKYFNASLAVIAWIAPLFLAHAIEPSDPYPVTRIEWLATNLSLKALQVQGASTCFANMEKKVIICSAKTVDGTKDLKAMFLRFFEEEAKKLGLAGKVQLNFL